jgi:phospholipase C
VGLQHLIDNWGPGGTPYTCGLNYRQSTGAVYITIQSDTPTPARPYEIKHSDNSIQLLATEDNQYLGLKNKADTELYVVGANKPDQNTCQFVLDYAGRPNRDGLNSFDHVVVLMMENRSFDNLLGYLYQDGVPAGKKYEGLNTGNYPNPVPKRAVDHESVKEVKPQRAQDCHQPFPDPGEFYQHVNIQLFNHIDPDNIGVEGMKMHPPYNLPSPIPSPAPMNGFVNDYINTLQAYGGEYKIPDASLYSKIMQCFQPDQVPALATLAQHFAVFDHWHCSVPSQTWCNRAFWHIGTSGGFVINPVGEKGQTHKQEMVNYSIWKAKVGYRPNLFTRLYNQGLQSNVYSDNIVSLNKIILGVIDPSSFSTYGMGEFHKHIRLRELPDYSFIEPKFLGQHNDMHPSSVENGPTTIGTVKLGDELIAEVYNTIFSNPYYRDNTLLIVTTDEHGGCFDHVSPPAAVPPDNDQDGQKGFKFDRLGVRVPTIMISSYIQKNTIINDTHDHTSFIKTLSDKWGFEHLTERDRNATSFSAVFSDKKRNEWPVLPSSLQDKSMESEDVVNDKDHPLSGLQLSMLSGAESLASINNEAEEIPVAKDEINTIGQAEERLKILQVFLKGKQ